MQLTAELQVPSAPTSSDGSPVWKLSHVRKGRLKAVIISTAVFILLASAAVFFLALETHPLWGSFAHTPAQVTKRVEVHSGKSLSCDVWLRFSLDGTPHETKVPGHDPCSYLPPPGSQVDLVYDPKDLSGVIIAGRDSGIRMGAAMIVFASVFVVLPSLIVMITCIRSYRNARKSAGKKPWREITADVKGFTTDTLPASLQLHIQSTDGTGQDCLVRYSAPELPGFAPVAGSRIRLWIVADGDGHAIITAPGCAGASDATISTPNSFELRTLGL